MRAKEERHADFARREAERKARCAAAKARHAENAAELHARSEERKAKTADKLRQMPISNPFDKM